MCIRDSCNISIINNNDNAPVCDPGEVIAEVVENAAPNTLITTLVATDVDVGPDGDLSYSMVSGDSSLFRVASSGEVFLIGGLDREAIDEYVLQADACDSGTPQLCCGLCPVVIQQPMFSLTSSLSTLVSYLS